MTMPPNPTNPPPHNPPPPPPPPPPPGRPPPPPPPPRRLSEFRPAAPWHLDHRAGYGTGPSARLNPSLDNLTADSSNRA